MAVQLWNRAYAFRNEWVHVAVHRTGLQRRLQYVLSASLRAMGPFIYLVQRPAFLNRGGGCHNPILYVPCAIRDDKLRALYVIIEDITISGNFVL